MQVTYHLGCIPNGRKTTANENRSLLSSRTWVTSCHVHTQGFLNNTKNDQLSTRNLSFLVNCVISTFVYLPYLNCVLAEGLTAHALFILQTFRLGFVKLGGISYLSNHIQMTQLCKLTLVLVSELYLHLQSFKFVGHVLKMTISFLWRYPVLWVTSQQMLLLVRVFLINIP